MAKLIPQLLLTNQSYFIVRFVSTFSCLEYSLYSGHYAFHPGSGCHLVATICDQRTVHLHLNGNANVVKAGWTKLNFKKKQEFSRIVLWHQLWLKTEVDEI